MGFLKPAWRNAELLAGVAEKTQMSGCGEGAWWPGGVHLLENERLFEPKVGGVWFR